MDEQEEKKERQSKRAELDTETTVADMNVEGFSWYNPALKNGKKRNVPKLTKKEQRAMIRGAFRAMIPMLLCMLAGGLLMVLLAYTWLK